MNRQATRVSVAALALAALVGASPAPARPVHALARQSAAQAPAEPRPEADAAGAPQQQPEVPAQPPAAEETRPRTVAQAGSVIWHDPGDVASLDFAGGPGGADRAPKGPFKFLEEDLDGSNPKVKVVDGEGQQWGVKWGREVRSDVFASRLVWATGYYVEPSYFVPSGTIEGARRLTRAKDYIDKNGRFTNARFERKNDAVTRLRDDKSWSWADNPFVGTRELNGLKVMVMLVSDWDNKDQRDFKQFGSNTAVWQVALPGGGVESRYVVSDWGGTMGRWGRANEGWKVWDCAAYGEQTREFTKGTDGGFVKWGFRGQRADVTEGVRASDVQWLLQYLGAITDDQLRAGLMASGATRDEAECFARNIRARIEQLKGLS